MRLHAHIHQDSPSGDKIRCFLAHDHVLLRQGLRRLLEDEPDMEVVAETGEAARALEMLSQLRPEVVITDASIFAPGGHAEQLILRASPGSKVLFLSLDEGDHPFREPRTGKTGWAAVRRTSARDLVEMIRRVCSRKRDVVQEMPRQGTGGRPSEKASTAATLTAREREVLELLAEGKTVRSAAGILGLSAKTVDAHKFNLMRKLGIHNKAELVMWAIHRKYVKLPANF